MDLIALFINILNICHFFLPFFPPAAPLSPAPPAGAAAAAAAAFAAYYFLIASKLALILNIKLNNYCSLIHSKGLVTSSTIMSVEVFSHVHTLWTLRTLFM